MPHMAEIASVNKQIEQLRRQVLISLIVGFAVVIVGGFLFAHYYLKTQHDLHVGSCTGRLSLIRTLEHAKQVSLTNPALTPEQKQHTADFYQQTIALTDVSDCDDVHLPPPPPVS
jgi:hypothetical protein